MNKTKVQRDVEENFPSIYKISLIFFALNFFQFGENESCHINDFHRYLVLFFTHEGELENRKNFIKFYPELFRDSEIWIEQMEISVLKQCLFTPGEIHVSFFIKQCIEYLMLEDENKLSWNREAGIIHGCSLKYHGTYAYTKFFLSRPTFERFFINLFIRHWICRNIIDKNITHQKNRSEKL